MLIYTYTLYLQGDKDIALGWVAPAISAGSFPRLPRCAVPAERAHRDRHHCALLGGSSADLLLGMQKYGLLEEDLSLASSMLLCKKMVCSTLDLQYCCSSDPLLPHIMMSQVTLDAIGISMKALVHIMNLFLITFVIFILAGVSLYQTSYSRRCVLYQGALAYCPEMVFTCLLQQVA